MSEACDVPCRCIVAVFINGEDQLPLLKPAANVEQAQIVAAHLARDRTRPVVKVFVLDGNVMRLVLTVRGPTDGRATEAFSQCLD